MCRPAGYRGTIITHGSAVAFINAVVAGGSFSSLPMPATAAAVQVAMGWMVGVRLIMDNHLQMDPGSSTRRGFESQITPIRMKLST